MPKVLSLVPPTKADSFSFANWPKSATELAAAEQNDAALWTPRDVLIDTLRQIDAGEITPTELAVIWRNDSQTSDSYAGPDSDHKLALLERVKVMGIMDDVDG